MRPPLPRLPVWAAILAAVLGFALIAVKAKWFTDPVGWGEHFASDTIQVFAGLAFAIAGLSEAIRLWQMRVWKRQTGFIVLGLMRLALNQLAAIGGISYRILEPAGTSKEEDERWFLIHRSFYVPQEESRLNDRDLLQAADQASRALRDEAADASTRQAFLEQACRAAPDLVERARRARDALLELSAYREAEAQQFIEQSTELIDAADAVHETCRAPDTAFSHDYDRIGFLALHLEALVRRSWDPIASLSNAFRDVYVLLDPSGEGGMSPSLVHTQLSETPQSEAGPVD